MADAFRREYLCDFAEDPHLQDAVALWRDYYAACEAFDRRVCAGPMGRDGILPATSAEYGAINRHAQEQVAAMYRRAEEAGIGADVMRRAQAIALRTRETSEP